MQKHIHFTGIGGTAMGSVAIACKNADYYVTGSDEALYPPMSDVLAASGIHLNNHFSAEWLQHNLPDVLVMGNAISRGNPELEYALSNRITMWSMAQFVGEFFIGKHTSIVVAGTHGKTSTTSITAHILEFTGQQPGFMIGGVPATLPVGCRAVPEGKRNSPEGVFVVEGDEYDTAFFDKRSKFVHYRPTIAILHNLEFDHADIFNTVDDIIRSFSHLVRIVPANGCILANSDDSNILRAIANAYAPCETVGFADDATWKISDIQPDEHGTHWTVTHQSHQEKLFLPAHGVHNVRNATMAAIASLKVATVLSWEEVRSALRAFVLPKRRLEHIGTWRGCTVIDDFAHHPTAIVATLEALRQRFPSSRIHACFEPRSNTSTRSFFQHEFEECFNLADSVCIGPVNRPERYAEHERLNTDAITLALSNRGIPSIALDPSLANTSWGSAVIPWLDQHVNEGDVIALLSNGNLGGLRAVLTA